MVSVLLAALSWLAVTLCCAGVVYACGRLFFWRQVAPPGALFAALALVMFGVSALLMESTPLASVGQYLLDAATPLRMLFFLFFCVFPAGRLVWRETRWMLVIYAVFALALPFPLATSMLAVGFSSGLGDALHVLAIAVALIPQLVPARDLSAVGGCARPLRALVGLGAALALLAITALFARATYPPPPVVAARTAWYLLVSLVPVGAGLALLRARVFDRAALARRALIYGPLAAVLVLTYLLCVNALLGPFTALLKPQTLQEKGFPLFLSNLLSLLLMALLFQPLRLALRNSVDGLLFRPLRDTARRFAAFGATAHEEIRVDALCQGVLAQLRSTLRPHTAALWVRLHLSEDATALLVDRVGPARSSRPVEPRALELYRCAQTDGAGEEQPTLTIRPDDPLLSLLLQGTGPVALDRASSLSSTAAELRATGMSSVVSLVERGDLVGLIALSEGPGSFDLSEAVAALAADVAPALRVAQRVHEQEIQSRERERVEQELQLARRIQQSFLPHAVPSLEGWRITPYYQPAREVGGDFYDFLVFADHRLGLIVGDVTGKGVPAALVMATTRSMLRAAAQQRASPGAVLAQVNDLLCPDVPPGMFATCFYAILDPATGRLRYANAGHELPYHRHGGAVTELYATGMPLGLMPGRQYEEGEAALHPGDAVLLYSDGLVEAHDRRREMFGRARLALLVGEAGSDGAAIDRVLTDLAGFTAPDWEQEDDITLLTVQRSPAEPDSARLLDAWSLPSVPGNERLAMRRVRQAVQGVLADEARLAQLETAVAEATLNAMEHGNAYQADRMVEFEVLASPDTLTVRIGDQGDGPLELPASAPDLAAKLAGDQSPRGWGLFLIKHLVDDLRVTDSLTRHTVELRMTLAEGSVPGAASDWIADAPPAQSDSAAVPRPAATGLRGSSDERSKPMQQSDVTLTVRRPGPAIACIDIQGDITGAAEEALTRAYAEAGTPETRSIILNFSGLGYMNSVGIGLLVTLLIRMQRRQQRLLAYGLSEHYRRIFQLTRLDEAIVLTATEAEALDAAAHSA